MCYFNFVLFLFLNFIADFCNSCIRTPTIESGPTITTATNVFFTTTLSNICGTPNPCIGSFTSSGVTVVENVPGSDCAYTIQVSCIDPTMTLITINIDTALQVASPTTFTCDSMTSTYLYNIPAGSGTVNNLQCACPANTCPTAPSGAGVDVTAPTLDATTCIYSAVATCTNTANSLIFNMDAINALDGPQTLTCIMGTYQYNSGSTPPTNIPITTVECGCRPNSCTPFTGAGAGVDITPSMLDATTCFYTSEVTCANPSHLLFLNMNSDQPIGLPQMLVCKSGVYQLDYGAGDVAVNSLTCECAALGCDDFIGENAEIVPALDDATCIYRTEAVCTNNREILTINMDTQNLQPANPAEVICDGPGYTFFYLGIYYPIEMLKCDCGANPCAAFTAGPDVTLSTPVVEGDDCIYSLDATCTNPAFSLFLNMDESTGTTLGEKLTCRNGNYQFFAFPGGDTDVTNIECRCPVDSGCSFTNSNGAIVSAPMSDTNCEYTVEVSCDTAVKTLAYNGNANPITSPQTLTCNQGSGRYRTAGGDVVVTVTCICPPDPCLNSFTVNGDFIFVRPPTSNADCTVYSVEVLCLDFREEIVINVGTDRVRAMNTDTFICDVTAMKYVYNSISINDVECFLECEPSRCEVFPAGPGMTVSAPTEATGCSVTVTCDTGTQLNVQLQDMRVLLATSPQTFTCTTGLYWIFNDGTDTGELYNILGCV